MNRKMCYAFGFQYKVKAAYPHISWYMATTTNVLAVLEANKNAPPILAIWKVVGFKNKL